MLADQGHGDDADGHHLVIPAPQQKGVQRRAGRGHQGGQRRITQHHGDAQPGSQHAEPEQRIKGEEHSRRGGHPFAALETEEHRVEVPEKHGQRHQRDNAFAEQAALHEHLGQEYRQPAFEQIAQEGQRGRLFVAAAQDVGRARVLGAVAARIGQPEHTAGDHGKRY